MNTNHLESSGNMASVNAEISGDVLSPAMAKARLRALGWTIRDAAAAVGLKQHMSLYRILKGDYQNRRVLREIAQLGMSPRRRYARNNSWGGVLGPEKGFCHGDGKKNGER